MEIVKINDLYFKEYISKEEIQQINKDLASQIKCDLPANEIPIFIGILNGCFVFMADLIREFEGDCELSFVKLASYAGTNSTDNVKKLIGINEDLTNRTVVIVEDVVDTGNTLEEIYKIFEDQPIKELKIVTLFFKPHVYKKDLPINYIGKEIGDEFIVGYGLDYNELGRNFPSVYQLTDAPDTP